jgi:hypothetical protein
VGSWLGSFERERQSFPEREDEEDDQTISSWRTRRAGESGLMEEERDGRNGQNETEDGKADSIWAQQ